MNSNAFSAADMTTAAASGHRDGYQAGYADAVKAVEVSKAAAAQEASAIEQIAQQWDGCMYDGVGETINIGEAIRAAGKRLLSQPAAAQKAVAVWTVTREGDPTFPRAYFSEAAADAMVAHITLAPFAVKRAPVAAAPVVPMDSDAFDYLVDEVAAEHGEMLDDDGPSGWSFTCEDLVAFAKRLMSDYKGVLVADAYAIAQAEAKRDSTPAAPGAPEDTDNPADTEGGIDGDWYCEGHPWALQGHDGCDGAGLPACARIDMLRHIIRMRDQEIKERDQQYGFLANSALTQQPAPPWIDLRLREMLDGWKNSGYPLSYEGQCAQKALNACIADVEGVLIDASPKGGDGAITDSTRLDFIAGEFLHIEPVEIRASENDADVGWVISQYHMGKGLVELIRWDDDNLRSAIDAAIQATSAEVGS